LSNTSDPALRLPLTRPSFLTRSGPTGLVLWTIAISAVVRLLLAGVLGYGTGEGYYLATARHLALSYFDQPPVSLWLSWAMIQIFGVGSEFGTRLPFVLMFGVTTWLMFRLGARLFGEWAGAWAAVLLNLSLVFATSIGSWVQPDGPLFLFLLAAAIPIVDLCFGKPARPMLTWALAGAAFGLAFLSKYHAALTLAGLLLFVATAPGYRGWFFSRGLVVAAAIATVIFLPVLIWNGENHWASFAFQGGRLEGEGLRFDWLLRSIGGQAVLIGILIWPPLMVVFWKGLRAGPRDPKSWLLCCLAIIPIILFTVVALWAPLGWHFHWQAPGYVFLFPLLGKAVAERLDRGDVLTRRWLQASAVILVLIVAFVATQARFGWVHAVLPASLKEQVNPTAELLKWDGLREALVKDGILPNKRLFAIVPSWTIVGRVDTEIGDDIPVVVLSKDPRNIAYGWNVDDFLGWDAVIITPDNGKRKDRFAEYFREMGPPSTVEVRLGGVTVETLRVVHARDYYRPYPLPLPIKGD
jgi:hypothetical protein